MHACMSFKQMEYLAKWINSLRAEKELQMPECLEKRRNLKWTLQAIQQPLIQYHDFN